MPSHLILHPGVTRARLRAVTAALIAAVMTAPSVAAAAERPAYAPVRQAEDWGALADPSLRTGRLDALKYRPLGAPDRYLTFGGDLRLMHELYHDEDWGLGRPGSRGSLLVRSLAHADLRWGSPLRVFAQVGSSHQTGRDGPPRPNDTATFYLNAGFLELATGAVAGDRFELRAGRMELLFGAGRLLSFRGRPNVRQSHDGGLLRWRRGGVSTDLFWTWDVRHPLHGPASDRLDDRRLFGVHHHRALGHGHGLDLYVIGTDRPRQGFELGADQPGRLAGPERRRSLGARWHLGRPGVVADLEVVAQWGTFSPEDHQRLDIAAWGAAGQVVRRWPARRLAEAGLQATWHSGDHDPGDATLGTFRPPSGTGAFIGGGHEIGYGNLALLRAWMRWRVTHGWALQTGGYGWARPARDDGLYAMPGRPFLPAAPGRLTGWMPELVLARQVSPHASVQIEAVTFVPGDYLEQVTPGRRISFVATAVNLRF